MNFALKMMNFAFKMMNFVFKMLDFALISSSDSTRAADKGNLAAHNTIGYYHERQGDYITALKHFKQAADRNNSYGHYNIALLYSDGLGTLRQDKEKALKHFIVAAELGHPSCMLMMGFYYLGLTDELGDPVTAGPRQPRDCATALKFLIPIAQIGSWGSFRQDIAEGYVRGLRTVPKVSLSTPATISPPHCLSLFSWSLL